MYISKIFLKNFRSFKGKHTIELTKGINFFVGNNNCGKTTIFRAIEFIQSGKNIEEYITKGIDNEPVSVELEFSGNDIPDIINYESNGLKKYQEYIINDNGNFRIRILRSSEITSTTQRGKTSLMDIRQIRVYNPKSGKYENPTGIDKTISALFDAQFVYSDLRNEDFQDFGKTKIMGKILNNIMAEFQKEKDENGDITTWGKFKEAHSNTFGDKGFLSTLHEIEQSLSDTLTNQYGDCSVSFNFSLPDLDSFLKNGSIILFENGISTSVSQKGTGMQRALALSLIQVYAGIKKNERSLEKPILFFIDEPETFLHPEAQRRLIQSLNTLAGTSQIFITTHSPYLLKFFNKNRNKLFVFYKNGLSSEIRDGEDLNLFNKISPTWGEINYYAFGVLSVEFHDELYGLLQTKSIDESQKNYSEESFNEWLKRKGNLEEQEYIRLNKDSTTSVQQRVLPVKIRNIIHHPENSNNSYNEEDLKKTTQYLIDIFNNLNKPSV